MFGKSFFGMVVGLLTIIGALNWGLVGLGYFFNRSLNVVNMIAQGGVAEAVIYIIVGLSAVAVLIESFRR